MKFAPRDLGKAPATATELIQFGVDSERANGMASRIVDCLTESTPNRRWMRLSAEVLSANDDFDLHRWLFECVHFGRDAFSCPPAAWLPTKQQIASANVTQFAREQGLRNYNELFAWANQIRAEYWDKVIESLDIHFAKPPRSVWDGEQWLADAALNISDSCFQADPQKTAIVVGDETGQTRRVSYGELETLVNRVANGLRESQFGIGDRLAIMMPMTVEAVAAFLGSIRAGCIPVSIAESFAPREISVRLRLGNVKGIFLNESVQRAGKELACLKKFQQVETEIPAIVVRHRDAAGDSPRNSRLVDWDDFLSGNGDFSSIATPAHAETTILFSSGTTGEPKAIPWSQTTPLKCAADGRFHQNIHDQSVVAWPTSLGWMMGPWLIYATLLNRATMAIFDGAPHSRAFCEFVQEARVTMLGVVPSLIRAWRNRDLISGLDWSSIETFSSTGECSNHDDMLFLMSRAGYRPIIEYCGGTEIGGGYLTSTIVQPNVPACFSSVALGLDLLLESSDGSLWSAVRDTGSESGSEKETAPENDFADERETVRFVDHAPTSETETASSPRSDSAAHEDSVRGEVFLVGPSIGLSQALLNADHDAVYYKDTPEVSGLPRLRRHGDALLQFGNGYYQACGRTDDAMNLGGIKVSAVEIENCLNQLSSVRETAAIASTDVGVPEGGLQGELRDGGTGPACLVIFAVAAEEPLDPESLRSEMQTRLSSELNPLFRVARVVLIDELPRTASNKVMRRVLRDRNRNS